MSRERPGLEGWGTAPGWALLAGSLLVVIPGSVPRLLGWGLVAFGTVRDPRRSAVAGCLFVPFFVEVGTFDVGFTLKPAHVWVVLLGLVLLRDPRLRRIPFDGVEWVLVGFLLAVFAGSWLSPDPAASFRLALNWVWVMAWFPVLRRLPLDGAWLRACWIAMLLGILVKGGVLVVLMASEPDTMPDFRFQLMLDLAMGLPLAFVFALRRDPGARPLFLAAAFAWVLLAAKSTWLAGLVGCGAVAPALYRREGRRILRPLLAAAGIGCAVFAVLLADGRVVRIVHDGLRTVLPVREVPWDPMRASDLLWSLLPESVFPGYPERVRGEIPDDPAWLPGHVKRQWPEEYESYKEDFVFGERIAYELGHDRVVGYVDAWRVFRSRPVLGTGLAPTIGLNPHNLVIVLLSRTGVVGTLLFLVGIGMLLLRRAAPGKEGEGVAGRTALVGWLAYGLFEFAVNYFIVWAAAGLLAAACREEPDAGRLDTGLKPG